MSIKRRDFIKITGLSTLGLVAIPASELLAEITKSDTSRSGMKLAMVIDLQKCNKEKDCTDCIDACHGVHNVPNFVLPDGKPNRKDEIKWIWKEHFGHAFHEQQHEFLGEKIKHIEALVLCNHCENPPCVSVCPTQATWKRDKDGIVMMDWHRCIGCRYCIAACPYGSRSFNWLDPKEALDDVNIDFPTRMKGVVEKCTFCNERLAREQQPACVDACKAKAIVFGDLHDPKSDIRKLLGRNFTVLRKPGLGTNPAIYYIV